MGLDQDYNYLISLSMLITCLLDDVLVLKGEVTSQSLLGVERLTLYLTCSRFYNHDNVNCENIQIYHQTSLQKLSEH